MKKITFLVIVLLMFFSAVTSTAANEECISTTLTQSEQTPEFVEEPTQLHRSVSATIVCTIGFDDLIISGTDVSEIVLFEIYDDSGFCLANFSNKEDFLNYIFTIRGTVEIKFHIGNYVLSGWIEL